MINNEQEYFKKKEELQNKYAKPHETIDMKHRRYMKQYSKEYLVMMLFDYEEKLRWEYSENGELKGKIDKLKSYINGFKGLGLQDNRITNG